MKQKQQQQQEFKQQDVQAMEQQYMVFQDLDNVTGIFAETLAVLEYFKDCPDHPYTTIAQNRLILQMNLSNAIMFDLKETSENDQQLSQKFSKSKETAQQYFNDIHKKLGYNDKIDYLADHYEKCNLSKNNQMKQVEQLPNQIKAEFNENSLQKVINGMFEVDKTISQIKQGKGYVVPTKEKILDKAKQRHDMALMKLKKNFPNLQKEFKDEFNAEQFNEKQPFKNDQSAKSTIIKPTKQQQLQSTIAKTTMIKQQQQQSNNMGEKRAQSLAVTQSKSRIFEQVKQPSVNQTSVKQKSVKKGK